MSDLNHLFYPRSVAVIGISNNSGNWGGGNWVESLLELRFEGKIYPISPKLSEFKGLKTYPSIEDVPDIIDLAVVSIPAKYTPQLMEQCARKGVGFVQLFTAGYSEASNEGADFEKQLVKNATDGGVRVVGPNCMGVYCPSSRFCWRVDFPRDTGVLAFMAQSGFNAAQVVLRGAMREVHLSKLISYGNAADLNESDYLEYFVEDPETMVIGIYIEGTKDGRRFANTLRKAAQTKPVIVLKGGRNQGGARAAASHTGSLAGSNTVWQSLLQQTGVIGVYDFDELLDTALAFQCLSVPRDNKVALIGMGGGLGVLGADECEDAGLILPPFSDEAIDSMRKFIPQEGTSLQNPLDSPFGFGQSDKQMEETITIVASCPQISSLIIHLDIDIFLRLVGKKDLRNMDEAIIRAVKKCGKPATMVLRTSGFSESVDTLMEEQHILVSGGIPVYPSIYRAARAISKVLKYQFPRL